MKQNKKLILSSIVAALALFLMIIAGIMPIGTYAIPVLASLLYIVLVKEIGYGWAVMAYAVTSIMSLIHVTSKNFEKALQAAPGVAVVDFFATWCGPCKMLAPVIEEAAEDMPEIQFYKVDVDEAPELARSFKVMSVPTLAFFKNGELVKKNVGAVSYEELEELINSAKIKTKPAK